jgi:hypothetical protein
LIASPVARFFFARALHRRHSPFFLLAFDQTRLHAMHAFALVTVLAFFDTRTLCACVAHVSRTWRAHAYQELTRLTREEDTVSLRVDALKEALRLDAVHRRELVAPTQLRVRERMGVSSGRVTRHTRSITLLQVLRVETSSWWTVTDDVMLQVARHMKHLRVLRVQHAFMVHTHALRLLLLSLPHLHTLELQGMYTPGTDQSVLELLPSTTPRLRCLILYGSGMAHTACPATVAALSALPALEVLDLTHFVHLHAADWRALRARLVCATIWHATPDELDALAATQGSTLHFLKLATPYETHADFAHAFRKLRVLHAVSWFPGGTGPYPHTLVHVPRVDLYAPRLEDALAFAALPRTGELVLHMDVSDAPRALLTANARCTVR